MDNVFVSTAIILLLILITIVADNHDDRLKSHKNTLARVEKALRYRSTVDSLTLARVDALELKIVKLNKEVFGE